MLRPCRPVVRSPGLGVRSTKPRLQFQLPFRFVPEGLFSLHHVPASFQALGALGVQGP